MPGAWMGSVVGAVEEGDHLGAVAGSGGAELGGGEAGCDAILQCPEDGGIVEIGGLHISEGVVGGHGFGLTGGTPQEGDHLGTVAGAVGTEFGGGDAGGDAVLHSPKHGFIEEVAGLHIGEAVVGGAGLGRILGAPEEGDHVRAKTLVVG